jgi:histidine triad (HIT) family protein
MVRASGGFDQPEGGAMMTDNLFLKILNKQVPAKIAYEDDRCLAFHDINPQAPVHVLIIPRRVIATHDDLTEEDRELVGHLHLVAARLAKQLGLQEGYRVVVNCRERAGQTVPHLHLHLLGGRDMTWPPG